MLVKIRENIFVGNTSVTLEEIKKAGITVIEFVSGDPIISNKKGERVDITGSPDFKNIQLFMVLLKTSDEGVNKPHVKDIACHIPKYMTENGEIVAILGETGLVRAPFVAARAICELESKSIYDIMVEMQEKIKGFDIGKAYL